MHPATAQLLRHFRDFALPREGQPDLGLEELQRDFLRLAEGLAQGEVFVAGEWVRRGPVPPPGRVVRGPVDGLELTACLRKLLEARDCAVRAVSAAYDDLSARVNPSP